MQRLTREQEVRNILSVHGAQGPAAVYGLLEKQFGVLTGRAQILLGLCGIMVTTTGFSGRMIAGTNNYSQWLIIVAMAIVLTAALIAVRSLLSVNWLTQLPGDDIETWLRSALDYRDRKTRLYDWATVVMAVGLSLYACAIGIMLRFPGEFQAPMIR